MSQLTEDEKRDMIDKVRIVIAESLLANDYQKIERMKAKVKRMGLDTQFIQDIINTFKNGNQENSPNEDSSSSNGKTQAESEEEEQDIPKDESYYLVEKVLKTSDYYEILQVERSSTISKRVLKKQYRQLAMKLHPDSNRHKKATEAFQKVNKAYDTLTDETKKRVYDQFGTDDHAEIAHQQQAQFRRSFRGTPFGGGQFFPGGSFVFTNGSDDLHDELLRQFFGGSMFGNMHRRRHPFFESPFEEEEMTPRTSPRPRKSASLSQIILSCFLFLALVIFPLITNIFTTLKGDGTTNQAVKYFSFSKSSSHPIHTQTYLHPVYGSVDYYISSDFKSRYYRNPYYVRQIDDVVFPAYKSHLQELCKTNRRKVREYRTKIKKTTDANKKDEFVKLAEDVDLSSCDILREKYST